MAHKRSKPPSIPITPGNRSVAIGGNVSDSTIVTGNHVTVIKGEREAILNQDGLARLTAEYLQAVEQRWLKLEADEARPPLESVFFMLQARQREERRPLQPLHPDLPPDPARHAATDALPAKPPQPPPPPLPLGEVLKREPHLVILGEPGTGKTTALQFIALCFARRQNGKQEAWHRERLGIETPWIPILLNLQTRAAAIAERDSLFDVLVGEVRSYLPCTETEAYALLKTWQATDGLLILLDGLDEVSQSQGEVREKIARLRGENTRLVVTSRLAGFTALGDLKEYAIKPLEEKEAQNYLTTWLKILKGYGEALAAADAKILFGKIRVQPALRRLTDNPLLLRLIAEYYARTGDIVRNRAELYQEWISEAWKRAERRGAPAEKKQTALAALEALAWHRQTGGENTHEAFCRALQDYRVAAAPSEAENMLTLLREKVGLLALDTERKDGRDISRYLFAHQTVREYFVARHLLRAWEQNAKRTFRFLKLRLHFPEWREPLFLLEGLVPQEEAGRLVEWIWHAHSAYEHYLKRDLFLAAEMIADSTCALATPILQELIAILQHGDWGMRRAAKMLGKIGDPQAVPALIEALWYQWDVRQAAAVALGEIGDPQAIPALTETLRYHTVHHDVREAAAEALGKIGDLQVVPALIEVLRHEKENARYAAACVDQLVFYDPIMYEERLRDAAAYVLEKIGQQAVPALIEVLRHEKENARYAAAEALGKIGDPDAVPALIEVLRDGKWDVRWVAAEALGKIGDPQAVPALCNALRDENENVRLVAAGALEKISSPQAIPALIEVLEVLRHEEWTPVHWAAAGALRKIGDPQAVPALIEILRDKDKKEDARETAAIALGEIGDPQAVPALTKALRYYINLDVRWAAAYALGKIGNPQAILALIKVLRDGDRMPVLNAVAYALGKIGSPQAERALFEALRQGGWSGAATANALGEIGDPQAVPALIEVLRDGKWAVRWAAAKALGEIGDPQAVPALCNALRDEDTNARWAAAEALGKIGDPQAVPALCNALRDENENVRLTTAEALKKISSPQAIPALIEVLWHEEWTPVRRVAAEALEKIGSPQAEHALLEALRDRNSHVRCMAAKALGKIGSSQCVAALTQALHDEDWTVRRFAAKALGEVGDPQAVPALTDALWDEGNKGGDCDAVTEALGAIGNLQAATVLIEALKEYKYGYILFPSKTNKSQAVHFKATRALEKMGSQAVPALTKALRDEDWEVRKDVAEILEKIGSPAVPVLIETLQDKEWQSVHQKAAMVLLKILNASGMPTQETITALSPHIATLVQTAADLREYELLCTALQIQGFWRAQTSPWQDPLQPTPFEARLQQVRPSLVGLLLAMALTLLGVLLSGAWDVLKTRLFTFLQSWPFAWLIVVLLLLASLIASIESLRKPWEK